jgi:peroxiredoxin
MCRQATNESGGSDMKRSAFGVSAAAVALLTAPILMSAPKIGEPAPDFSAMASNGKTYRLSEFRGKFVVLEWHNNGCPYTRKHYESGNMQRLQRDWTEKGVVWFTVISSAPGTQGYVTADQEKAYLSKMGATPTAALLDPSGEVGHLYDAKTTPHMIIINPQGVVIYDGAIDDHPTSDASDIPASKNFVSMALGDAMAGKPVSVATSRPYGCSVKYAGASH